MSDKEEKKAEKPSNDSDQAKRDSWLNSNMTFLMVLLNGFILTGTAFAILSVFINEMRAENTKDVATHFKELMLDDFYDLERSINASAAIVEMTKEKFPIYINAYTKQLNDKLQFFDHAKVVEVNGEQIVSTFDIDGNDGAEATVTDALNVQTLQKIVANPPVQDGLKVYLSLLENRELLRDPLAPFVLARPFILAKAIKTSDGKDFIYVYQTSMSKVIGQETLQEWGEFSHYTISTADSEPLLKVDYNADQQDKNIDEYPFEESFFNLPLNVLLGVNYDQRNTFLGIIPYLMLMFGGVLTIIGTLYVHNNQRQSTKLSSMNKALANKNMELNQQIFEKEKIFQALKKSEAEHRDVINSVNDVIFEADKEGKVIFLNESWTAITGLDNGQTLGKTLTSLVHPEDVEDLNESFNKVFVKKSGNIRLFAKIRTLSGKFREAELTLSMLRKDENDELRLVGTIVDLEERRRAEQALAEAEKKYRNIVENASAGIFQITQEGQFISANMALAKLLGYKSPFELMNDVTDIREQLHCEPERRDELLKTLMKESSVSNFELKLVKKGGEQIWVNESTRLVKDDDDNVLYYEGIMEDITKRKEAEIAMREAKVESDLANRAKSEFLANMSHELRTPLNAIIGFSEIIKNEVFGPVGQKEYNEYSEDIYNSGRRLLKVINEILDVSKIEAGERQLNETVVDLGKAIATCHSLVTPKLETAKLKFENKLEGQNVQVIGEELAIKQMLMNLLSNAIKFTPSNGVISIYTDVIEDGSFKLCVSDTGIGMNAEEVDAMIAPFVQKDTALSKENDGTGLGLTLVNSLMKLHDGELQIESEENKGTVVSLIFPKKRVPKKKSKSENSDQESKADTNVVKFKNAE